MKPYRSQSSRLVADPANPKQVIYHPRASASTLKRWQSDRSYTPFDYPRTSRPSSPEAESQYINGTFSNPEHLIPLNSLGQTDLKAHAHHYSKGWYQKLEYSAGHVVAPQNFKCDFPSFPLQPCQQQVLYAGNGFMPLPRAARVAHTEEERKDLDALQNSVFVRGFHIPPADIHEQAAQRYWAKHAVGEGRGQTQANWLQRMRSSFLGGRVDSGGIWLPKGEIFSPVNRIDSYAEARQIWDTKVNPSFSQSQSFPRVPTQKSVNKSFDSAVSYKSPPQFSP